MLRSGRDSIVSESIKTDNYWGIVMGSMSNESKQKWVNENRKQIKIVVAPSVAEAFKAACVESGQSINKTLMNYMESVIEKKLPKTTPQFRFTTRPQRRKSLAIFIEYLRELRDAEFDYSESIPENLQGGERYEQSLESIENLDKALETLEDVY